MSTGTDPRDFNPQQLLETLLKNPIAGGAAGGLAGSILGSVLMGKGGGKKLVKAGGLALVGTVAWKAWQQYQQNQRAGGATPVATAPPLSLHAAFDLESRDAVAAGTPLRVVQAMIAAAKADGVIDSTERAKISQRLDEAGLGAAERQRVAELLDQPMDLEAVVRDVDSSELAAEIYAASALAVHPASRVERGYLDMLGARLGIEPALAQEIDRSVTSTLGA